MPAAAACRRPTGRSVLPEAAAADAGDAGPMHGYSMIEDVDNAAQDVDRLAHCGLGCSVKEKLQVLLIHCSMSHHRHDDVTIKILSNDNGLLQVINHGRTSVNLAAPLPPHCLFHAQLELKGTYAELTNDIAVQ